MQYRYRAIKDQTGSIVSFAVSTDTGTSLWHMRNIYNGDVRTGSRESQSSIPLDQLTIQDLPPIVSKKLGKLSIGTEQITPDLTTNWDIGQYFRELVGLPRLPHPISKPKTRI